MGCDQEFLDQVGAYYDFNPRTHVGCDLLSLSLQVSATKFQSTHPRGVRPGLVGDFDRCFLFQSTHPRGVRLNSDCIHSEPAIFQSTHPRGVRLVRTLLLFALSRFQSTHPRGVRPLSPDCTISYGVISIHAPTWGATKYLISIVTLHSISIHAPTWGATLNGCLNGLGLKFQSTHPRGVRPVTY